ncbi:MoxR-like ATPase [Phaeobacter piscinae]|uniref:MoxR-like ATPase n=2 Tax=Phaeobacter piscinae TaxID=1580596 RepID=A0ABN5DCW0_9RHOB|nr:MoxR-like ATPase [Phaeobacter piscinae]AUQ85684.1 MoxR-like ATPase [Phaeobacter piscinae]AUR23568.1 MoxR-like ATPase [Phaeobacter piscinae]
MSQQTKTSQPQTTSHPVSHPTSHAADPSAPAGARGMPGSIDAVETLLTEAGYVADRGLATVVFLSLRLGRPLFLEGEAGVGKTEIAKTLAAALGRRLIRLQCYEGLDASSAVYEWNFAAQMIAIRAAEAGAAEPRDRAALQAELFSDDYLIRRPLLEAMQPDPAGAPILLIDELDRTDEPFEAFLLEALSDFQVTIPELGTIKAPEPPIVILTSNRTREVHDALKRRCLYHWVDYPDFDREMEILTARAPGLAPRLSQEVVAFVQALRTEDLFKHPGIAETIDWANCLLALDVIDLSPEVIADTLGAILKYQDDISRLQGSEAKRILDQARATLGPAG